MVVSQQILYADSQTQNEAHIPLQAPIPSGVHSIEISWDRTAGWMRAVINATSWHFKELLGKAQVTSTDSIRGRINVRAMARLEDETLTLYRAPDAVPHSRVAGVERRDTHNRLCYRRSHRDWRVRDERRPEATDALVFVTGYVGDLNVEWEGRDPIAHIYHNGGVVVDKDRLAHLYDNG